MVRHGPHELGQESCIGVELLLSQVFSGCCFICWFFLFFDSGLNITRWRDSGLLSALRPDQLISLCAPWWQSDCFFFSPSLPVHAQHFRQVLQRLLENQLYVKAKKCIFHTDSFPFLEQIILAEGVKVDTAKVRLGSEWPVPDSQIPLQQFLELPNF